MSDNKTTQKSSKAKCTDGVCYLAVPELEVEPEEVTAATKVSINDPASATAEPGPDESTSVPTNSPTNANPNGPDGLPLNLQTLFASTLQNLQNVLNVDPQQRDDDLTDTEEESSEDEDDWEEEDVEDSPVCVHLNDQRWKAFSQLLESHNALCRAFEKMLSVRVETDGEEDSEDESDSDESSED